MICSDTLSFLYILLEISDEETMQFCLDFSMQQYITTRSYRLHNCSHITTYLDDEQFCASFHHTTPSTNEVRLRAGAVLYSYSVNATRICAY